MNGEKDEKRKRAPVLKTILTAVKLVYLSGHIKSLIFISIWILLGAVTSYMAVFNEKFLNGAADLLAGKEHAFGTTVFWLLIWGGTEVLISIADFFSQRTTNRMWQEISFFQEKSIVKKVLKLRLAYFDNTDAQKKISQVKHGFSGKMEYVIREALDSIRCMVTFITALTIVWHTDWRIALIITAATIPTLFLRHYQTEQQYKMNQWSSFEGQMQRYLALVLTKRKYVKEMRFYQLYDYVEGKYDESVLKIYRKNRKLVQKSLCIQFTSAILINGSIAAALALISIAIFRGDAKIGAFMLIYNSVRNMQSALSSAAASADDISSEGRYLEDYETVMNYEEEAVDSVLDIPAEPAEYSGNYPDTAKNTGYSGSENEDVEIAFDHVTFSYPGSEREVIKELSVTIKPGEKIAIVGENGSGKSTFVALLTGLYSPTRGRILINGRDLQENLAFLREKISCTMQDFLHYNGTILENVQIGDLKHSHEKAEAEDALSKADLTEYVNSLEKKGDTYLGNLHKDSIDLSGGQWQKLAMARNLYKSQAKIMLLDEPTAALDPLAESRLYKEFAALTQDKTVLLISHRLGVTKIVDRILVFDGGQIVEDGAHEELYQADRLYTKMYNAQMQWYQE